VKNIYDEGVFIEGNVKIIYDGGVYIYDGGVFDYGILDLVLKQQKIYG
jgi:hypothetical protein